MELSGEVNKILDKVKKLDHAQRLILMRKLSHIIMNDTHVEKIERKISDISGVGAEIWHKVDVEQYLKNERQWD